jgi:WhiB family transcriptional regulator, redox-sensing transcriptional regulator
VRDGQGATLGWLDAATSVADDEWALAAACRDQDPLLFFGPNRFEPKRDRLQREATAKAVCATCPALDACREHALREGELYGVWGGLGEADRRAILARGGALQRSA